MRLYRSFFANHLSRRARFAGGRFATLALILTVVLTAGFATAAAAKGPKYPAPGSGTETTTGTDAGLTGGVTFSFTDVNTKKFKSEVWGLWYPQNPATWSFGPNTATLAYNSASSNLAAGEAVFSGSAEFPYLAGTTSLPVQLVVQAEGGVAMETAAAANLKIPATVGAVIPVTGNWSVNLTFEVSPDGGTTWDPADTYYNNTPHNVDGNTSSSVSGAFWFKK